MYGHSYRIPQYPKAIRLVAEGLINVLPLVTHRFAFQDAVSAFHFAADSSQGAIKVQILVDVKPPQAEDFLVMSHK
jgi:threonine dehydrogenase-like Zn-dependent dehydrogenase